MTTFSPDPAIPDLAAFSVPLGVAGWAPVLMVLAGFLLLCVELLVLPGFGVAGLLGVIALIAGGVLALTGPPGVGDVGIAIVSLVSAATMLGVGAWAVVARRRGSYRALFGGSMGRELGYLAALPRPELEGRDGIALTDLRPAGNAEVDGERLDVVSEAGWIAAGTPVRVVRAEGYRHVVRALPLPPPRE